MTITSGHSVCLKRDAGLCSHYLVIGQYGVSEDKVTWSSWDETWQMNKLYQLNSNKAWVAGSHNIHQWIQVTFNMKHKKRFLLRCIHHFKSDLIYNMDHMHISGTETST